MMPEVTHRFRIKFVLKRWATNNPRGLAKWLGGWCVPFGLMYLGFGWLGVLLISIAFFMIHVQVYVAILDSPKMYPARHEIANAWYCRNLDSGLPIDPITGMPIEEPMTSDTLVTNLTKGANHG